MRPTARWWSSAPASSIFWSRFAEHPQRVLTRDQLIDLARGRAADALRSQRRCAGQPAAAQDRARSEGPGADQDRALRRLYLLGRRRSRMKSELARFYPSSLGLAARIGFILIGAVVLSIGISTAFIFIVGEGRNHMPVIPARDAGREDPAPSIGASTPTPAGARDAASLQAEAPILRIDWPATSHQLARTPPPGYLRDLRTFLLLGLHDPTRGVAVGVSFPPGFGEGPPPGEPPEGQPAEGQPGEGQPPGPPPGPPPSDSGPAGEFIQGAVVQGGFARNRFASSVPRSGSRCSSATAAGSPWTRSEWRTPPLPADRFPPPRRAHLRRLLLLSLWVIRGFMRPIIRLAAAAERLGLDGDVSLLQRRARRRCARPPVPSTRCGCACGVSWRTAPRCWRRSPMICGRP